MAGLTVENYVTKIKEMTDRERKKIRLEELLNIIIQVPDVSSEVNFGDLTAAINCIRSQTNSNAAGELKCSRF